MDNWEDKRQLGRRTFDQEKHAFSAIWAQRCPSPLPRNGALSRLNSIQEGFQSFRVSEPPRTMAASFDLRSLPAAGFRPPQTVTAQVSCLDPYLGLTPQGRTQLLIAKAKV